MKVLYNANIKTCDDSMNQMNAIAIRDGKILATGSNDEILDMAISTDEKENMGGKTILPGFTDSHIHLQYYAMSLTNVDCETSTMEECLQRIKTRAQSTKPGEWIVGHGWNHNTWHNGYGCAEDIDQVAPNHPVFLTSKSVHSAWVNTQAMVLAGINEHTPDPAEGSFQRDSDGKPTGILLESAMNAVQDLIPNPDTVELSRLLLVAQKKLHALGITGVHDFDGIACYYALQSLDNNNKLKLRVLKGIPLDSLDEIIRIGYQTGSGSDFLKIGSVKLFADGALGPQTAAMLSPYEDNSENYGFLLKKPEELLKIVMKAAENHISSAIHAIGDSANRVVIDVLKQTRHQEQQTHKKTLRHRIEHVQIIQPEDIKKMVAQKIIASVQPIHAPSDMAMADRYWGDRTKHAYAYGSLLNAGAIMVFGSDAPVETPDPFRGLYAATNRRRVDGSPGPQGWHPEQRIDLATALRCFTVHPAYAAGEEDHAGSLQPGYDADLIVLNENLNKIKTDEIHKLRPDATMIAGEWVFRA